METLKHEQLQAGTLSDVLNCLHEGVLILDHMNIVEQANEAALRMLGHGLVGMHISKVRSGNQALSELFTSFGDSQKQNNGARVPKTEDGYSHQGLYTVGPFRRGMNADSSKIIVLHDSTPAGKSAEGIAAHTRSLEKTNQELDQFAHIVSHDLKAPLRAISNLSLWLQEDLGSSLSGENRDNLMTLRARVARMESLINGILEYSRVGREQAPVETIDVYNLLAEVVESLSPPSHIAVEISQQMPVLEAPRVMLSQVFSNLVSNAIKYNDKTQGVIKVYAGEKETHFEFVVEDNGPGIPAEYHEKIFVIFQTLQARDKFESTGIGLTIVKRILAAIGGEIRVVSTMGEGSKFIFTWPK